MKKSILILILTGIMVIGITIPALATCSGDRTQDRLQTRSQDQTCLQDCQQTQITAGDQEQTRQQLRSRLYLTDNAKIQQQDRLRQQDQTQCPFTDMTQHWARTQIQSAYAWGFVNGYSDGSFNPGRNISGVEGVLMMSRMMNCLATTDAEADILLETTDEIDWNLIPLWAREQLGERTALRIASQSDFYGEGQLNRLQFAIMLAKALGVDPLEPTADTVVFIDQNEITPANLGYINTLRTLGIIEGTDGYFYPDAPVTRAESACMLIRAIELIS